jgi:hypothetical protein
MQDFLEHFPVVTLAVVAIVIVGAAKSILGDLSFQDFVTTVGPIAGLTAIGRGLQANGKARAGR